MRLKHGAVLLAALILGPAATAQPAAELPSAVATFGKLCLAGGLNPAARPTALSTAGWLKAATTNIDVPKLAVSKAIDRNYDFSKPETTEQWNGTLDGRPANVALARFGSKRRYLNLCA